MSDTVSVSVDARGVATLLLNRGDKHNALHSEMMSAITDAAYELGRDPAVRAVILSGAGASFCAGADLGWMREQFAASPHDRAAEARRLAMMLQALNTIPKPLIGRVHGNAFGGGIGMISVCDVAIGVHGARLGLTETRLGLIPATIGPYVIARMGEGRARRVFMSARLFEAAEAVSLGLLSRTVDPAELDAAIEAETVPYLSCAPGAVAEAKALARALGPVIDEAVIESTIAALVKRWDSAEAQQGIAAFFDKSKAPWAG